MEQLALPLPLPSPLPQNWEDFGSSCRRGHGLPQLNSASSFSSSSSSSLSNEDLLVAPTPELASPPAPCATTSFPLSLPHMANELWWDIFERLPLQDRMRAAQVCQRFQSLVCSQLRFLDLSASIPLPPSTAPGRSSIGGHESAGGEAGLRTREPSGEGLDLFIQSIARNCHNLCGLVMPPNMTTRVHVQRLEGLSLTSLSLYGCSNVNDDDLLILSRSSLSHSLQLLILCGTNVTDAGVKCLPSFVALKRLHACGTYVTAEGLSCLPSPAPRDTAVLHQEHSLFIFPGMTEALAMRRRGIFYNPFSLFSTSLIPSIHKNVRRLKDTITWLEKRQVVLDKRIRDKRHFAKHHIRLHEREMAMAALRRKKMYVLQRDRIASAGKALADSLLAFTIGHDLGLMLAPNSDQAKRRATEGLSRIDLQRQAARQASVHGPEEPPTFEAEISQAYERDRLLQEYQRLEVEIAEELHIRERPALPNESPTPTAREAR